MPILYGCGNVKVNDMFISVNRCEVGKVPGKTAIMEVNEEFGIKVHAIVTVEDIHEYLKQSEKIQQYPPRHGRLHGKILHPVNICLFKLNFWKKQPLMKTQMSHFAAAFLYHIIKFVYGLCLLQKK